MPAPAAPRVAAALDAGAATVTVPVTWQRTQDGPAIPGLEFDEPASVAGAGGELGDRAAARGRWRTAAHRRLHRFAARAPKLGDGQARAGRGVSLHRPEPEGFDQPLQLYVVPTDAGVIGVACVSAADGFMAACEEAAATLSSMAPSRSPRPRQGLRRPPREGARRARRQAPRPRVGAAQGEDAPRAGRRGRVAAAYAAARRTLGQPPANPTVRPAAAEIAAALDGLGRLRGPGRGGPRGRERPTRRARRPHRDESRFRPRGLPISATSGGTGDMTTGSPLGPLARPGRVKDRAEAERRGHPSWSTATRRPPGPVRALRRLER